MSSVTDEERKRIEDKIYKSYFHNQKANTKMADEGQSLSMKWYVETMKKSIQNRLTSDEMKLANLYDIKSTYATEDNNHAQITLEMLFIVTNTFIMQTKIKFKQLKEAFKIMDGFIHELNPYALATDDKKYNIDLMQMLEE